MFGPSADDHGSEHALPGQRYTNIAVALHWSIAALIIYQLAVGLVMEKIGNLPIRVAFVQLHGSLGMSVLALSVARLAWRIANRPPVYDARMAGWERGMAHVATWLLYALMLAMPLLGWSILSASARIHKAGFFLFWAHGLQVPLLPVLRGMSGAALDDAHARFVWLHSVGGYAMIALLCAHVAGALKHHWWDGQRSLGRMWFGRRGTSPNPESLDST